MSKQEFAKQLGKAINELEVAIEDSKKGEFERLKEFGITREKGRFVYGRFPEGKFKDVETLINCVNL